MLVYTCVSSYKLKFLIPTESGKQNITSKPWSPEKILYLGGQIFFFIFFFQKKNFRKKNFEKKIEKKIEKKYAKKKLRQKISSNVEIFTKVKIQNIFRGKFLLKKRLFL